jgi:hypothetical protein
VVSNFHLFVLYVTDVPDETHPFILIQTLYFCGLDTDARTNLKETGSENVAQNTAIWHAVASTVMSICVPKKREIS